VIIFNNSELLWLFILLLPLFYFLQSKKSDLEHIFSKEVLKRVRLKNSALSKKWRNILLILSMVLTIIALARPQIDHGEIKVKSSFINIVTAIDMSKSMLPMISTPTVLSLPKRSFLTHWHTSKVPK